MIYVFLISLPMTVCLIGTVLCALRFFYTHDVALKQLTLFFTASTLLYCGHFLYFGRIVPLIPVSDTIYVIANLMVFPLYYRYVQTLTGEWTGRKAVTFLSFAVPAAVGAAVGVLYYIMPEYEQVVFIDNYLYHGTTSCLEGLAGAQALVHSTAKVLFAVEVIMTVVMSIKAINRYHVKLSMYYTNPRGRALTRIKHILTLILIVSILSFAANIIGRQCFVVLKWSVALPSACFSVLLFSLLYAGLFQTFYAKDFTREVEDKAGEEEPDTESNSNISTLIDGVKRLVEDERMYLIPDLSVSDLAVRLGTNRQYVYDALRQNMDISFTEYVNKLRVDHSVELLKSSPEKKIQEIAELCGFSSQAAFYRNFKRFTGTTPRTQTTSSQSATSA